MTFYRIEQRELQQRFHTGRMADLLERVNVHAEVPEWLLEIEAVAAA